MSSKQIGILLRVSLRKQHQYNHKQTPYLNVLIFKSKINCFYSMQFSRLRHFIV